MDEISVLLRNWRRATGLKQGSFAALLGVSQATVSRWENGVDEPSAAIYAKFRALVDEQSHTQQRTEERTVEKMPGLRALVDLDGMRLLATSPAFKAIWPEVVVAEGRCFADHLLGLVRDLYHDDALMKSIRSNEVAMISAVSDRQISGFGDNAFRHYWAASYRKVGTRHLAEISYEACEPDAELGIRHILRVDEIE